MTRPGVRWPWQPPEATGVVDADWVWIEETWQAAIDKAVGYYRQGRRGRGEYELARAALGIAHRLEDVESVQVLGSLRLFEPCAPKPVQVFWGGVR